jgi:hypothetical protein
VIVIVVVMIVIVIVIEIEILGPLSFQVMVVQRLLGPTSLLKDKRDAMSQVPIGIVLTTTSVAGPLQKTDMTDTDKTAFLAQLPIGIFLTTISPNRTSVSFPERTGIKRATTSASGLVQRTRILDADRNPVLSHLLPADVSRR